MSRIEELDVRAFVLILAVACGPGLTSDAHVVGRNALVEAANDPVALERLLHGSVVNGGLWFDKATCATQFGTAGEVGAAQLPAFARCLATLRLHASAREDALGDVVVMQYAPGIEVEARVVPELAGPQLTWIGYESRRSANDNAPTITAAALESLRIEGDRNGPLDPTVASTVELDNTLTSHAAFSWLKVCLDETGAVIDVHAHETTSARASIAFSEAARRWKFRPFTLQGQPVPVCAMVRLVYPASQGPAVEVLPLPPPPSRSKREPLVFAKDIKPILFEARRIAGEKYIYPEDETKVAMQKAHVGKLSAMLRLCLDEAGHVESVVPMRSSGFASYDRRLLAGTKTWLYAPFMVDGEPMAVCTYVVFIYSQR